MARYSIEAVVKIGTVEDLSPKLAAYVNKAFEGGNGSATKIERSKSPKFSAVWNNLEATTNPKDKVPDQLFKNLGNGRVTILGIEGHHETEACINILRQKAKDGSIGPLEVRGVADKSGNHWEGIVKSLVVIRIKTDAGRN